MSPPRKQRGLPPPDVLAVQKRLRVTLTFAEAAQLISFKLTDPVDFAADVLEVVASDIDVLTDLIDGVDPDDVLRLFQQLRARVDLATRLNDLLNTALNAPPKRVSEKAAVLP